VPSLAHETCAPVDLEDGRVLAVLPDVIFEMYRTMYASHGAGLAAPQVGIRWRLAVIDTANEKHPRDGRLILLNPEPIVEDGVPIATDAESCVSLPYCTGQVPRPEGVRVRNHTLDNSVECVEAEGRFARVIQHEMDHLDGKTYIDRLPTPDALDVGDLSHITRRAQRTMDKLEVKGLTDEAAARP
jgi:peptide deformylase